MIKARVSTKEIAKFWYQMSADEVCIEEKNNNIRLDGLNKALMLLSTINTKHVPDQMQLVGLNAISWLTEKQKTADRHAMKTPKYMVSIYAFVLEILNEIELPALLAVVGGPFASFFKNLPVKNVDCVLYASTEIGEELCCVLEYIFLPLLFGQTNRHRTDIC